MRTKLSLAASLVAISFFAINSASAAPASASSYDPATGHTTTSTRNADGTHTVTVNDGKGGSSLTVFGKPGIMVGDGKGGWKPYNPPPKPPIGASSYDPSTGRTTSSTRNADGSHTVTVR